MNSHPFATRPIRAEDTPFLFSVYASTRRDELAPLGWSVEQQTAFLAQQFHAQHHHYQTHYVGASFDVVLHAGEPLGRLYVERTAAAIQIIDIALLPTYRNAGIGTQLLGAVLHEGAAMGLPVRLHVEKHNPARRLYERLGFAIIDDRGMHWLMEWPPHATDSL